MQRSRELDRILALPRRQWADEGFAAELTKCLKRPGGTMTLLPIQAQALCELIASDGLVAPIRVGGGKTLITLLAPFVVRAKRPLLVTRASLLEKTKRDIRCAVEALADSELDPRGVVRATRARAARAATFQLPARSRDLRRGALRAQPPGEPHTPAGAVPDSTPDHEIRRAVGHVRGAITARLRALFHVGAARPLARAEHVVRPRGVVGGCT